MERNKLVLWISLAVIGLANYSCAAPAYTEYGFSIGVTNAPPPPRVVFVEEPEIVVVPGTRVYMVSESGFGYDMFRYGSSWYLYSGGFWYRSSTYRGSFAVIDVRSVPSPIMKVPASRWKHHPHGGPPGQMKAKKRGGPAA
jgi:hypothetical protein